MNNRVLIKCYDCGHLFDVSETYYRKFKNKREKIWRCKLCNSEHKSLINLKRWQNLSDEERREFSEKQSQTQSAFWERIPKEERSVRLNNFIKAGHEARALINKNKNKI